MDARTLYSLLVEMSFTLDSFSDANGDKLRVSPSDRLTPGLVAAIKSCRDDLLRLVQIKLLTAETNRRIAAAAPDDWEFPADDERWLLHEAAVDRWSRMLDVIETRAKLAEYEAFALGEFARGRLDASPPIATGEPTLTLRPETPTEQPEWAAAVMPSPAMLATKPAEPNLPRIKQAVAALLYAVGGVAELRVLGAGRSGRRVDVGYFDANHHDDLAAAAFRASKNKAAGVYVTLNPLAPGLLARAANRVVEASRHSAKDEDVLRRRWFAIDIDARRPSGTSSTEDELAEAHATACEVQNWLADRGWPAPLYGSSGNGAHLLYSVNLENTPEAKATVKACLAALAQRFDSAKVEIDPAVCNAARIWKLYGTVSRKGDHMPDRPHRLATIESMPERFETVKTDQLTALASLFKPAEPKRSARRSLLSPADRINLARKYLDKVEGAVSGNHGHDATFRAACILRKGFDLDEAESWELFKAWNERCVPPWDEHELRRKLDQADKAADEKPRGYLVTEV